VGRNDTGNFIFLNLETLETKFRIPPNERRRVNREKIRKLLLDEVIDRVHWNRRFVGIEKAEDGIVAVFKDGSRVEGSVIVGSEGSNSRTRQLVAPETYRNVRLPVRLTGLAVDLTPEQVRPLRELDPLLFQGCHPSSSTFLWVSMIDTPESNGTKGTDAERYRVQILMSWLYKSPGDEVKPTQAERLKEMKRRAEVFHENLRGVVQSMPDDTGCVEIVLQDWPHLDWDNHGGRVTLAGDAAHAMTMYRGEAANHGILDALKLCGVLESVHTGVQSTEEAIGQYETELKRRAIPAVLLSRQACLDAHDLAGLNEHSAVLKRRAID
jgi:2-polyprenyl-6-methoxyphenol hydroxylase-like FAD-dependent oxidoreductase